MAKVVALIFEGVECLILYFPACSAASHYLHGVCFGYGEISNPTEAFCFAGSNVFFSVLEIIDARILIRIV